jgi:putative ABC transport system substrate-binding protein
MRRRAFIAGMGAAAAAWPLTARGQPAAMPVIGYFSARLPETDAPMLAAFRQGLAESGYVEGTNVGIEFRWGGGEFDRLRAIADELVHRNVSVIVTSGGDAPALAARDATNSIPIVFNSAGDPVRFGLVASLNRPGGNVTGVNSQNSELITKQFGLIRELVPAGAIALLVNAENPNSSAQVAEGEAAARSLRQQNVVFKVNSDRELEAAFAAMRERGVAALVVTASPFFVTRAEKIVTSAAAHNVPTLYFRREFVDRGGLVSYGSSTAEAYRLMGVYTGKILNGAKPRDLPVIQMTKFEFIINLKAARGLGLDIPPMLLARADEVIE